jgi:putative transposase
VQGCSETLRTCSEKHGFAVLAYCFMPDHLHLLVEGGSQSDLPQFVKDFKQQTAYAHRRSNSGVLWQKSYYDHILRAEEDVRDTARYIVGNPVRAGLATIASDHPHSGSFDWGSTIVEA